MNKIAVRVNGAATYSARHKHLSFNSKLICHDHGVTQKRAEYISALDFKSVSIHELHC